MVLGVDVTTARPSCSFLHARPLHYSLSPGRCRTSWLSDPRCQLRLLMRMRILKINVTRLTFPSMYTVPTA